MEEQDIIEKEEDTTQYGIPKIASIQLSAGGSTSRNTIFRCDETLTFKALINGSWEKGKTPDKDRVSWSIWKREANDTAKLSLEDPSMQVFAYYGEEFALSFNKAGEYAVEGFGKDPKDRTLNDTSCTLTFSVIAENKITDILLPQGTVFKNTSVSISVKTLIDPNAEELEALTIRVADSANSELHLSVGKTVTNYTFINAGTYIVEAYYSYNPQDRLTKNQDIYSNNLLEKLNPDIKKVRHGEAIDFSVSLEKAGRDDYDKVKWEVLSPRNTKIIDGKTGKNCKIPFSHQGQYLIKVKYKEDWMSLTKTIDHTITCVANKIERLECDLKKNKLQKRYVCYAGDKVELKAVMTMDYKAPSALSNGDGMLSWNVNDRSLKTMVEISSIVAKAITPRGANINKENYTFIPTKSGRYTISVQQEGQIAQSIDILVNQSRILEWMFTDEYKNYRKYSGWKQKTHIYIQTEGWESREVTVALWFDRRKGEEDERFIRLNIQELQDKKTVSADGELFIPIGSDSDLWTLIEQQEYSKEVSLCFTVCDIVTDCQNKLDDVYNESGSRNKHIFRKETNQTYTYIPVKTQVTGYFSEEEGRVLKRIIDYNATAYMIVNIASGRHDNSDQYKFIYKVQENIKGNDDRLIEGNYFTPDENGVFRRKLPLSVPYGEITHRQEMGADYKPRLFYFIVTKENKNKSKDDIYSYPEEYGKDKKNDAYLDINIQKQTTAEEEKKQAERDEEYRTALFGAATLNWNVKSFQKNPVSVRPIDYEEEAKKKNKEIDSKNKETFPKLESTLGKNYSLQLKVAKDTNLNKSLENIAPVIIGEGTTRKKRTNNGSCPRCKAAIRATKAECQSEHEIALKEIFPNVSDDKLKIVADTYNKYMVKLEMNTCRNKAHFFAQVAIETGYKLDVPDGEGFNYYWEKLISTFAAFQTTEGREKAKEWGRSVKDRGQSGYIAVPQETQIKIANYAYGPPAEKAKELGNTESNDGWTYRGQGIIQLTGKDAYIYANQYTKEEGFDIVSNPNTVSENLKIGVLTAMAFWKWKKIYNIANDETKKVNKDVCELVGKNVEKKAKDGSNSTNYVEKQKAFDEETSKLFRIDQCKWNNAPDIDLKKTDIITYHIFANPSKILKQIPKENKKPTLRRYVYHDKDGTAHFIQDLKIMTIPIVKYRTAPTPVDGKVEMIDDIRNFKGYESPDGKVKAKIKLWDSYEQSRWWINPECFAGILGAMLTCNIDFLAYRGSSTVTGGAGKSSTHMNGVATDIAYFGKHKRTDQVLLEDEQLDLQLNVDFINALIDYGYRRKGEFYTQLFIPYGETRKRLLVKDMGECYTPRHNNHLHIGGFNFSTVKIIKDE